MYFKIFKFSVIDKVPSLPELSCETSPPYLAPTSLQASIHRSPPRALPAQTPCISGRKSDIHISRIQCLRGQLTVTVATI